MKSKFKTLIILFSILFIQCNKSSEKESSDSVNSKVSIKDGKFSLNDKLYYPLAVNYLVSLQADANEVWASSSQSYFSDGKYQYITKDSCHYELEAEMELIREMGFNSVRFVGIGETKQDESTKGLFVRASVGNERDTMLFLNDSTSYQRYFNALKGLFDAAGNAGLKVVFLSSVVPDNLSSENHLEKLAKKLKGDNSILAFDLFNEPLYFDPAERDKEDVFRITKRWNQIVKSADPDRMITIGLTGMREVLEWDPNIINVDFVSFHPYEYENEQVVNELCWYGKYVDTPFIIGETAVPADNDSVPYSVQSEFARKTMIQAANCGAIGYTWWQYKDVRWVEFHSNYMGVLSRNGVTSTRSNKQVFGMKKPVADEFLNYSYKPDSGKCLCLPNYYNYSESKGYKLTGKMIDVHNNPIEGGVILAWSEDWKRSNHTITKKDGTFELKGDFEFFYWKASFVNYNTQHQYILPKENAVLIDGNLVCNVGTIKLQKLHLD